MMAYKISLVVLLSFLSQIGLSQNYGSQGNNSVHFELQQARNNLDTNLYKSIFTWYLVNSKYSHGKPPRIKYIFIPVLNIDEDCFISINCDYTHSNFNDCITSRPVDPQICALYTADNINWGFIKFNNMIWYATDDPIKIGMNISSQNIDSFNELHNYLGSEIFYMAGLFCKLEGSSIKAYIGNGVFKDFSREFESGRFHSSRFAFGCK